VDAVFDRALAKNPSDRYDSSSEFVDALAGALRAEEIGPTRALPVVPGRREPVHPPSVASRSRPGWILPLVVVILLATFVGGVTAAYLATRDSERTARPAKKPHPVTVTQRETLPGATELQTVTTTTPAEPTSPSPTPAVSIDDAVARTDQATGYLRSGDWSGAWTTVKPALNALRGTYADDFRYEAYAYYDAGKALAELGRCEKALPYLDRSESLQGSRSEIDEAQSRCGA
jgi:hypothetical protein